MRQTKLIKDLFWENKNNQIKDKTKQTYKTETPKIQLVMNVNEKIFDFVVTSKCEYGIIYKLKLLHFY